MFTKVELIAGGLVVLCLVLAFSLFQREADVATIPATAQVASVGAGLQVADEVVVAGQTNEEKSMKIDDIKNGSGEAVQDGDTVVVHYVGRFENGQEFDSSKKRGEPFEFTVGARRVIAGWEQGLLGMKVGGERVLVVPPELGYGDRGVGPIPGGATLIFTIELLEIK